MDNELYHYGIQGMRWGVRRFQNSDGTLTAEGEKRYNKDYGIRGMRWGVRRFQNSDGTLTAAGKKRYNKELESYRADKKKLAEETRKFERVKKNKEKVEKLLADKQALIDQKRKLKAEKKAFKSGSKPDAKSDEPTPEQIEAKKKKVLESRSAKTLYENADLFSNEELTAAYNRLSLENNIKNLAPETVSRGERALDNVIKYGGKVSSILGIASKAKKSIDSMKSSSKDNKGGNEGAKQNNGGNNQSSNKKQSGKSDKEASTNQSQKEAEKAASDAFDRYTERALSSMMKNAKAYAKAASSVNVDGVSTSTAIQLGQAFIAGLLEEPK